MEFTLVAPVFGLAKEPIATELSPYACALEPTATAPSRVERAFSPTATAAKAVPAGLLLP